LDEKDQMNFPHHAKSLLWRLPVVLFSVLILLCGNVSGSDLFGRILTSPGEITAEDRWLQFERFPLVYQIKGELPKGEVHWFAMVQTNHSSWWLAQWGFNESTIKKDADNLWDNWKIFYRQFCPGEVYQAAGVARVTQNIFTFLNWKFLTFDMIKDKQVTAILFAIAPKWQIQKGNFSRAHIAMVVFR